jgi:hypothetical protein
VLLMPDARRLMPDAPLPLTILRISFRVYVHPARMFFIIFGLSTYGFCLVASRRFTVGNSLRKARSR